METPSAEQMVQKAIVSSETSDNTYSLLNVQQRKEFIQLTIDQTVMLKEATNIDVEGQGLDVPNIDVGEGRLIGGLGGTELPTNDQRAVPTFGGRQIRPQAFDYVYAIETTKLFHNSIVGENIADVVMNSMAVALANDIENVCINSIQDGDEWPDTNPGFMTTIDGWRQRSMSGHVVDWAGQYVNPQLFKTMLEALPTKWRGPAYRDRLRFYCSVQLVDEYVDYLQRRTTALGDEALTLTREGDLVYRGIPIVPVPYIKNDYDGLNSLSGTTDAYTWVLLTMNNNLIVGWGPEMRLWQGTEQTTGKIRYVAWWGQFDTQFSIIDAVVSAVNVTPSVDPTLSPAY